MQVGLQDLVAEEIRQALEALVGQNADFVRKVLLQLEDLRGFNGLVALVLFSALAGEDFDVDDSALNAGRAVERSVANVASLFAEDGAQQLFFRRERGLALGRDLADTNDAALVQVAQERLADVGNVASDFLGAELGVARFDFVLLDVNRSVVVVLNQLFADQDGVFEVVAAPWQKGHQHVAAESEFTALRARTVGKNLALLHAVAHAN